MRICLATVRTTLPPLLLTPDHPRVAPRAPRTHARTLAPRLYTQNSDLPPKTDLLHKGHSKGGKLLVVMVGLPGTGKTYISRKVARYLRWINYRTRAFSLAR